MSIQLNLVVYRSGSSGMNLIALVSLAMSLCSFGSMCWGADASVEGRPPPAAFAGEKTSWHGFDRYDFLMDEADLRIKPYQAAPDEGTAVSKVVEGHLRCVVVVPKEAAPGN